MLAMLLATALATAQPAAPVAPAAHPRPTSPSQTRVYYIAADEVIWDYAPAGSDRISGRPFNPFQQLFTEQAPQRLGRKAKKALYREYTDSSFRTIKPRAEAEAYLGYLGPVIRAEIGDTIRVVFRNSASRPYSIHAHGVFYDKASEGAVYDDGTGDARGDAVAAGATYVYTWVASERAGPGPMDGSSVLWMYHSHVDEAADVNAGLMGPMIVTARGRAKPDGSPIDVDRELVIAFAEIDENLSHYIDDNIRTYALDPASVRKVRGPSFFDPFGRTNMKQTINGFLFGNGPMPSMVAGQRVRWYVMSTTNFELHAPHWHGNVVTALGMKTDVLNLGTMGMIVADMVPDNPGTWLVHCHVEPHQAAGMQARFVVAPSATMARAPR
jgi:hephaestin